MVHPVCKTHLFIKKKKKKKRGKKAYSLSQFNTAKRLEGYLLLHFTFEQALAFQAVTFSIWDGLGGRHLKKKKEGIIG